ncbi:MAG: PQQ-binding-like beta-propeller repeat protein [Kofleriaceae bacterium]
MVLAVGAFAAVASANDHDWPMYGRDASHTFATNSQIDKRSVSRLQLAWSFTPGDTVSASPAIVDGTVYVGSWDGYFYALDEHAGTVKWKLALDCDSMSNPQPARCVALGYPATDPLVRQGTDGGVVTSSAAVVDGTVYFGGGKTLYAVRARDGHVLWKKVLCGNPDARHCEDDPNDPVRIFSSPTVYRGNVYVGSDVDGAAGYRGRIWAIDANRGSTAWTFEVDPNVDSHGHVQRGAQNRGCGNVWSSAAIDEDSHRVIFTTGDCQFTAATPYHEAILALDANNGDLAWAFRPIPAANTCDFDFGASANIIDTDGKHLIGAGNKNGTYYALRPRDGVLAWSTNVVFGGSDGGFVGTAAFDGKQIYGATLYGDGGFGASPLCDPSNPADSFIQDPSFHAFDVRTGAVVWQQFANYAASATVVTNGVVISGTLGLGADLAPAVRFFDATNGNVLFELPQTGGVASAAVVTGNQVTFGTGNSYDGSGASIQAWRVGPR